MTAPLYGLVMAGGHSRRMGRDKARLDYHGLPQVLWTARLLTEVCGPVYVSCRENQDLGYADGEGPPRIHDLQTGQGPMGGLVSAHASHPRAAWFAVACDLPRLTADALRFLVDRRAPAKICTAYRSAGEGLPEPLCTVYEPAIMHVFRNALACDCRCPRKILIEQESRVDLIDLPEPHALNNVNTPQEEHSHRRTCR